jgi:hypothetical protein
MSKAQVQIEKEAMERLAEEVLNGRQIKSIVKQAYLLVRREASSSLRMSHIERALRIGNKGVNQTPPIPEKSVPKRWRW